MRLQQKMCLKLLMAFYKTRKPFARSMFSSEITGIEVLREEIVRT